MGVRDVARMLNRSAGTVREYCRSEGLPFRREGKTGRMAFDPAEVEAWRRRPEVAAMLDIGDATKGLKRPGMAVA